MLRNGKESILYKSIGIIFFTKSVSEYIMQDHLKIVSFSEETYY